MIKEEEQKMKQLSSKTYLTVIIAFMAIMLVTILGCTKTKEKEPEVVKIGAILPLTGNTSMIGEYIKSGIDLAVKDVNSKGGINGKQLVVEYGDSKNEAKEGVTIFNSFTSVKKIPVIISAMTGVTQALIPLADQTNTVLFATTVSASGIPSQSPWVYRLFITADIDAKTMAEYAARNNINMVGIFYVNDDFGKSFAKVFSETFERKGGKVVFLESFEKGDKDFKNSLIKIKKYDVQAIYLLGYANNLGIIPKQMREMGIKSKILSIGTIGQPNVIKQAGDALEGTIFTTTEFSADSPKSEVARSFVENFIKTYGEKPNYFSAFAYDSISILADVIKKHGYSSESIKKGLSGIRGFEGITGKISIKSTGDADFQMVLKKIQQGSVTNLTN